MAPNDTAELVREPALASRIGVGAEVMTALTSCTVHSRPCPLAVGEIIARADPPDGEHSRQHREDRSGGAERDHEPARRSRPHYSGGFLSGGFLSGGFLSGGFLGGAVVRALLAELLAVAEDLGGDLEEQTEKLLADLADPDRASHLTASAL